MLLSKRPRRCNKSTFRMGFREGVTFMNSLMLLSMCIMMLAAMVVAGPHAKSPAVYVVRVKGSPLSTFRGSPDLQFTSTAHPVQGTNRPDFSSEAAHAYANHLSGRHDMVLEESLKSGSFQKIYSYTTVLNAFTVKLTDHEQAKLLESHPHVVSVERDQLLQKSTTHTPQFLNLPKGAWPVLNGPENAGEGMVIGMLDTGIDPAHVSFRDKKLWSKPYGHLNKWKGGCEVVEENFPAGSCNGKVIGAKYFARGIMAADMFNETYDFASPFDGDGHGTHTSSIAAGSSGVPVVVKGYNYGTASGIAPRARIAVYKVIYRDGGFLSDVLAGLDQATHDGVDVVSISLGSTNSASGVPCLNSFDVALLFAVSTGIVVVHAAGNSGPYPSTMNSYGPWIISVGASISDRTYENHVITRNNHDYIGTGSPSPELDYIRVSILEHYNGVMCGVKLNAVAHSTSLPAAGTRPPIWYHLIYAEDALNNDTEDLDAEFYSYCQNLAPFNATLVRNKVLMCNFVEYSGNSAAAEFENAVKVATSLNAAGLIMLNKASSLSMKLQRVSMDPVPYSLPTAFIPDSDGASELLNFYNTRTKRDSQGNIVRFKARVKMNDSRQALFKLEAPRVTSFSSRGPVYANTITSVVADLLKPDLVAPGNEIWGAWAQNGIDVTGFVGESFAMISGTSMATPHIAGVVALVKQKHPTWSTSAIHSALLTTASTVDKWNKTILAEQPSASPTTTALGPASPFDVGSGAVNVTASMDPGLVFETDFQDYVNFLCTLPGVDANTVQDSTGATCNVVAGARSSDLNVPSITIANLVGKREVKRTVKNVFDGAEKYTVAVTEPTGVAVNVHPTSFTLRASESIAVSVSLQATGTNGAFTFGSLVWTGDRGHSVRIPVSVLVGEVL
nr:subtilisin-like protease SBT2.6 [Physcomitrium patens]|eukprot:XP_024378520.1 subtilisin-like protease SBT2.6 [Physcomitrella patens]